MKSYCGDYLPKRAYLYLLVLAFFLGSCNASEKEVGEMEHSTQMLSSKEAKLAEEEKKRANIDTLVIPRDGRFYESYDYVRMRGIGEMARMEAELPFIHQVETDSSMSLKYYGGAPKRYLERFRSADSLIYIDSLMQVGYERYFKKTKKGYRTWTVKNQRTPLLLFDRPFKNPFYRNEWGSLSISWLNPGRCEQVYMIFKPLRGFGSVINNSRDIPDIFNVVDDSKLYAHAVIRPEEEVWHYYDSVHISSLEELNHIAQFKKHIFRKAKIKRMIPPKENIQVIIYDKKDNTLNGDTSSSAYPFDIF